MRRFRSVPPEAPYRRLVMLHRRQRFGVERRIPGITNGVTKAPSARDRHALIRVGIRIGVQDAAIAVWLKSKIILSDGPDRPRPRRRPLHSARNGRSQVYCKPAKQQSGQFEKYQSGKIFLGSDQVTANHSPILHSPEVIASAGKPSRQSGLLGPRLLRRPRLLGMTPHPAGRNPLSLIEAGKQTTHVTPTCVPSRAADPRSAPSCQLKANLRVAIAGVVRRCG
jgi:hypothetical protein